MSVIELLVAASYGQTAYELAQRVLLTGFVFCLPIWVLRVPAEPLPWKGPIGSFCHALLALGILLFIWTAPL